MVSAIHLVVIIKCDIQELDNLSYKSSKEKLNCVIACVANKDMFIVHNLSLMVMLNSKELKGW